MEVFIKCLLTTLGLSFQHQAPPHREEMEKLIRQLGDEQYEVRKEASRRLIAAGEDAAPLVERALQSEEAEVAARAREILESIYRPLNDLPEKARGKLREVEERIASLRSAGRGKDAEMLEKSFRNTRRQILSGKPPALEPPEVTVVGVYGAGKSGGIARVRVTSTDAPMILVLCAYDRTSWEVETGAGVRLERVIVGGYHAQETKGIPKEVPVIKRVHDEGGGKEFFYAYRPEDESFSTMARTVRALTGRPVSAFLGSYHAPVAPFRVGVENADWRNQRLVPLVDRLHEEATKDARDALSVEMRKFRFTAVHLTMNHIRMPTGSFGEFTPLGPIGRTLKPLKAAGPYGLMAVATDPKAGKTYGLTLHDVLEIDVAAGASGIISPKPNGEDSKMSWPQAATFDAKRRRLLVTNAAGATGHLWAYDPGTGVWLVLADMDRPHVTGLAYDAAEDVLYGVGSDRRRPGFFSDLYRFNPNGALLATTRLAEPVRAGSEGRERAQLVSLSKERLVLIVGPLKNPDEGPEHINRAYVVNPRTGDLIFSCTMRIE